jgi:hypothetical protein
MTPERRHLDAILEVRVDSFHTALEDLDPISRALIELSVIQGLDDGEISGMLGNDEDAVRAQREQLLRGLAGSVAPESADADLPMLEAIVARAINGEPEAEAEGELEPDEPNGVDDPLAAFIVPSDEDGDDRPTELHAVPAPDWLENPEYEARPREEKPRSRQRTLLIVLALIVALAVIVGIQRAGGSSNKSSSTPTPAPAAPAPAAAKVKQTKLSPVGTTTATGTAAIANGRLTMNVKGLADPKGGTYTVWLYNSVIDSTPIGTSKGTSIKLDVKLPADAKHFKYVDVSLQPAGSNANHSGESVLRVPLAQLQK